MLIDGGDSNIILFKGVSAFSDFLLIVAWLLASGFNKASIMDMDYDPDELEEGELLENEETRENTAAL